MGVVLRGHAAPIYPTHATVRHDGTTAMAVIPAVLAKLRRATGATCQEPVVQLREKMVEGRVKLSI